MAGNPIPGNPGKLRDLSQRLRGGWDTLRDLGVAIDQFQHADEWDSDAANEFRGKARGLRKLMGHAEYRFWAVAQALGPYAGELEEAQRLAGPAAQAMEEARGDLSRATSRHEQQKADDPESEATEEAWRSVDSAQDSIIAAEKRIGEAIGAVKAAAGRFLAVTERAVNDPLRDDDGWLAQQKRNLRRTGDWIADNPWVAPLIGVTSIPLGAFTFALGLASTEDGREFLEGTSDVLNVIALGLGVAGLFFPPLEIAALAVGVVALAVDGALYAHGRKDEGDLTMDGIGIATFGVGRVFGGLVKSGDAAIGAFRQARSTFRLDGADVARLGKWANEAGDDARTALARGWDDVAEISSEAASEWRIAQAFARERLMRGSANLTEAVHDVRRLTIDGATYVGGNLLGYNQAREGIEGLYRRFVNRPPEAGGGVVPPTPPPLSGPVLV
jgi:hypothetical protein